MPNTDSVTLPRFVIFEGVDGVGKTTLSTALANYYRELWSEQHPDETLQLYKDNFPGSRPGSLGEWVYRMHHGTAIDSPRPNQIAAPALQLLHVAAHVDLIFKHIRPTLEKEGYVILDRYWWSTYAYSRKHLSIEQVWDMVNAERTFWQQLPSPVAIYLSRPSSAPPPGGLRLGEVDPVTKARLTEIHAFYQEVIAAEREVGVEVHELENIGSLDEIWNKVLDVLELPPSAFSFDWVAKSAATHQPRNRARANSRERDKGDQLPLGLFGEHSSETDAKGSG